MNISDCLNSGASKLGLISSSAKLDSELIMCHILSVTREWLIAHNDNSIATQELIQFNKLLDLRLSGQPIAYIIGRKDFYGRNFIVNPDVLIPRPETETIIEFIKSLATLDANILDIGTGSGAIAITLSLEVPSSTVTASDISDKALSIASENARSLGAEVHFLRSDLLADINESFDLIVANLPYVSREWQVSKETEFEPEMALFAKDDGLDLMKKLVSESKYHLKNNGVLVLEMDTRQLDAMNEFAVRHDFREISRDKFMLALRKTTQ